MPSAIPSHAERTADAVLSVIETYRLKARPYNPDVVLQARHNFLPYLLDMISKQTSIKLVLPAFPFKSPNSVEKVLGILPDKSEEISLALLQGLCEGIRDVYEPGASLVIVSDGIVYNDLLGISDLTVWNYGESLRRMAKENGYSAIQFTRLSKLLGSSCSIEAPISDMSEQRYQELAPIWRNELLAKYGRPDYNLDTQIASDDNLKATYCGYIKFLEKDLMHNVGEDTSSGSSRSTSPSSNTSSDSGKSSRRSRKRHAQRIAKQMLARGRCFADLIEASFPAAIRLSIHASNSASKISINILPNTPASVPMTPWHSCMVCKVDGSFLPTTRDQLESFPISLEPVYHEGRLWNYREKSSLYDWGNLEVSFKPLYPGGLRITAVQENTLFSLVDMQKIRHLAEQNAPVILRNFLGVGEEELYLSKAREMGSIQYWKWGALLKVKEGTSDGGLNNVLSEERMPFHYDGVFKMVDGVPAPPRFQMFTAITASPKGTGHTLFAPSRLILQHLTETYPLDTLKPLTWNVFTKSFDDVKLTGLPLIIKHPTTGRTTIRYHEHWPKERTRFEDILVSIEGVSEEEDENIRAAIEKALYDRRVCIRVGWEKGDVLVSDNISLMHTREEFKSSVGRELWRIHVD